MTEEERPKLIVENKYIFNVGSDLYVQKTAIGYKDDTIGNGRRIYYWSNCNTGGGYQEPILKIELDLEMDMLFIAKNQQNYSYMMLPYSTTDYDTHMTQD